MNYKVKPTTRFIKELKRLNRKFPSLKQEISVLVDVLEKNPGFGTSIGNECFKIGISISSKGKGKRGGGRVITYLRFFSGLIYLFTIYDKSERADVTNNELKIIINSISTPSL